MARKSTPEPVNEEAPVFTINPAESLEQMDAIIAAKMCEVVLAAPALSKDERNAFAKYNYVSIDKYYETFAKVAAAHGLTWVTRETEFALINVISSPEGKDREPPKERTMAKITYAYDVLLAGVGIRRDFGRMTVLHGLTGPQTAGSAASYAEKLFCRVALKAVTGEKDGDAEEPHTVQSAPNAGYFPGQPEEKPKPVPAASPTKPVPPPPPPPQPKVKEPEPAPEPEPEGDDPIQAPALDDAARLATAIFNGKPEIERIEQRKYPVFKKRIENPDLVIEVVRAAMPCLNRVELKEFWDHNTDALAAMKEGDIDNYKIIAAEFTARLNEIKQEEAAS